MGRRAVPSSSSSPPPSPATSTARFLVRVAYNGAAFRGFQRQLQDDAAAAAAAGATPSVSFCLEHAAGEVLDRCCCGHGLRRSLEVRVGGYSRTDAGTHAAENACLLTVVAAAAEEGEAAAAAAAAVDVEAALASLTAESLDAAVASGGVCPGGGGGGDDDDAAASAPALRVLSCERLADGSREHVAVPQAKRYTYLLYHRADEGGEGVAAPQPRLADYCFPLRARASGQPLLPLRTGPMLRCVAAMRGRHDFRGFAATGGGSSGSGGSRDGGGGGGGGGSVRTVYHAALVAVPDPTPFSPADAADADATAGPARRHEPYRVPSRCEEAGGGSCGCDGEEEAARRLAASPFVSFEIVASGFLRGMVRRLAYGLTEVGRGAWTPERFVAALEAGESGDSRLWTRAQLPAKGLVLERMWWRVVGGEGEDLVAARVEDGGVCE